MCIYDYLIQNLNNDYKRLFEEKWKNFISEIGFPYYQNKTLILGNKFRPKLFFWGTTFVKQDIDILDYSKLINIAICIEAVHKASLLLDDIVDNDTLRYGYDTFHTQFGVNESIAFSHYIIGKSFDLLSRTLLDYSLDNIVVKKSLNLYSETISSMTYGVMKEISGSFESLKDIQEISRLETSVFLKNCLLLGYYLGNKINSDIEDLFSKIGYKCGFLYQLLNDLEPFLNSQLNEYHKGTINIDFDKCRKNIIIALIAEILGYDTIKTIFINKNCSSKIKFILLNNNEINTFIKSEISKNYYDILLLISELEKYSKNPIWGKKFQEFFKSTIKWGVKRANLQISFS